jgi:hypothetical protein
MKKFFIAAGLSFCLASPSMAADTPNGEVLIVPPYPAETPWKQFSAKEENGVETIEWRPAERAGKDTLERLVQSKNPNVKSTASQHIFMSFDVLKLTCRSVRLSDPVERIENGYTVAYAQAFCVNQVGTAKDIDTFVKAIRGKDALYHVTLLFHRPTTPGAKPGIREFSGENATDQYKAYQDTLTALLDYRHQVRLCPSAEPCPVPTSWPVDGKTPQSEIREKLGKPWAENQNPDGRHVDLYKGEDGLIRTYLFGKDDLLINTAVHEVPRR